MKTKSELGIGTYGLCGVYGKIKVDEYKETIKLAIENGIKLIDTF